MENDFDYILWRLSCKMKGISFSLKVILNSNIFIKKRLKILSTYEYTIDRRKSFSSYARPSAGIVTVFVTQNKI